MKHCNKGIRFLESIKYDLVSLLRKAIFVTKSFS